MVLEALDTEVQVYIRVIKDKNTEAQNAIKELTKKQKGRDKEYLRLRRSIS